MTDEDELIICDDCSKDETVDIIKSFDDKRIKLIVNTSRLGIIKNFEKCISQARNEVIFLADQDDEWSLDRVEKIIKIFNRHHEITLVLTNAVVVNGADEVIKENLFNFYSVKGVGIFRVLKNVVRNHYIGAMIAFKRNMTDCILPIPADIPMHDVWIGVLNDIYGRTYYLDEPLIRYRRHSSTATVDKHASLRQMAIWRYMLTKRLFNRLLHRYKLRYRKNKTYPT